MKEPKNIIVRMPNWIGDAVMATPILCDLRSRFPDSKITAMCQGIIGQLITYDPHIDEIFSFVKPCRWVHHLRTTPIIDDLKKGEFDSGLLLTNSFSSAWWFYLGGVKNRIGFGGHFRSWLLDEAVPFPKNIEKQHLALTYKDLLIPYGIEPSFTQPRLYISEEESEAAKSALRKEGVERTSILIGINPGAAYGSAKCWLPDRFHEVARELLKDKRKYIILFGDRNQRELTEEIAKGIPERIINLAGKTNLRELMAYISCLNVLLTNDSGPMHIGSALDVPLIALFGSTSDIKTGPLSSVSEVIHKHTECSPCYKRVCPIDFRCMTKISSEEVIHAINKMIYTYYGPNR